ncbi:MAG: hypothetical protein JW893_07525 [Candidatus Omnitrophica bacterium]|nr:hypothetical protein [Candidatus Omnitrophota bacterium]
MPKVFTPLVLAGVGLLLGLFMAELACRIIGVPYKKRPLPPPETTTGQFDSELGWSYIPDQSVLWDFGELKEGAPVYFDENGIRVPSKGYRFDRGKPSVLFIGGSFAMGHGLLYENSFIGQFQELVGEKYQMVNLGVQGYGSDQAYLRLKRYIEKFNTKVVVYIFIKEHIMRNGNSDRQLLIPEYRFPGTKPLFKINKEGELYLAQKPMLYKNKVNSWLWDLFYMRLGNRFGWFPHEPEDVTAAIIKAMKDLSEQHQAHFLLIDWREDTTDRVDFLSEMDVNVIDTLQGAPKGWAGMIIEGGVHPDANASEHIAQLLLNYFEQNGLLSL